MFNYYHAKGIILAENNSREYDKIFTIYTKEYGKVSVVGRSLRKGSSKLKMKMSLFSLVDVRFVAGKSFKTLVEAEVVDNFNEARQDLSKLSLFYRMAEIVLSFTLDEEADEQVFSLLEESFRKVNVGRFSSDEMKMFFCLFSFRFLYCLGYKPHVKGCAVCGVKLKGRGFFDAQEGGVVCESCSTQKDFRVCEGMWQKVIPIEDVEVVQSFLQQGEGQILEKDPKMFVDILEEYLKTIPRKNYFSIDDYKHK